MGAFLILILFVFATWLGCGSAYAEKRVALVIGNSAYKNVPKLANPANDAGLMAGMFRSAGFDTVDTRLDLNVAEMRKALREFGAKTRDADVAVMFYAGHGIELDGNNYLIPTDATLETDTDVFDEAFPLDRILVAVEPAKHLRLVILDACRDNPFTKTMKRTIASRAVGRGLAKVEPNSPNTLIAFAAKAGSTASDGDSRNSPFAAALVQYLPKPGLDLRKAFGFVRDDVLKNTSYKQEPYVYGSLGGDDVPLVPAKPVVADPQPNPQDLVRRDYELALQLGTRDGWNAFLAQYTEGFYANLAKGQLNKIAAEDARAAAVEKARFAEQEKLRLASEGAKKAEQAKAAAEAKAAEEARQKEEKAQQIEMDKGADAERARLAAESAAAEKLALDKAIVERRATEKAKAAEQAKGAESARAATELAKKAEEENVSEAERAKTAKAAEPKAAGEAKIAASEKKVNDEKIAAATPMATNPDQQPLDVPRLLQAELKRVGCYTGSVDSNWNAEAQKSLALFNKSGGMTLDVKIASINALQAVQSKTARVCPLICEHGYKADSDRCAKIICRAGYLIGNDNVCEKIKANKPTAMREDDASRAIVIPNTSKPSTAIARADQAYQNGSYRQCMGARSGCYARRMSAHPDEDSARQWCNRKPTC